MDVYGPQLAHGMGYGKTKFLTVDFLLNENRTTN
jgi:hypothetical protein